LGYSHHGDVSNVIVSAMIAIAETLPTSDIDNIVAERNLLKKVNRIEGFKDWYGKKS